MKAQDIRQEILDEIDNVQEEINALSESYKGQEQTYDMGFTIGEMQGRLNCLITIYKMITGQK